MTLLSNLSLGISLALIAAMMVAAGVLARRSTDRVMQPVIALLHATQQLAAGALKEDIPVQSHDELGRLTASFNSMRVSIEQAEAKQRSLSAIVESSHDAIVGTNLEGIITSWNGGAVQLFGYTPDEVIDHHVRLLAPVRLQHEVADFYLKIEQYEVLEPFETWRRCKDGSEVYVSLAISPVWNANGELIGVSGIARDLTDYRLRQQLAERNQELRDDNHFIRQTFGRYMTDAVVASVLDEPEGLALGGEARKVTMLMTDLRGFTSFAARLSPEQVIAFLNRYLETS